MDLVVAWCAPGHARSQPYQAFICLYKPKSEESEESEEFEFLNLTVYTQLRHRISAHPTNSSPSAPILGLQATGHPLFPRDTAAHPQCHFMNRYLVGRQESQLNVFTDLPDEFHTVTVPSGAVNVRRWLGSGPHVQRARSRADDEKYRETRERDPRPRFQRGVSRESGGVEGLGWEGEPRGGRVGARGRKDSTGDFHGGWNDR